MEVQRKSPLTEVSARDRRSHFTDSPSNLTYMLFLKFMKGDTYEGQITAFCDLQRISSKFFIDYAGTQVLQVKINSQVVQTSDEYESLRNGVFLSLPEANLQKGFNQIEIKFRNKYARDGCGLHSFIDTDGKQYTYTDFEPFFANKLFPCFDQPDLKASCILTAALPKDWVIIANATVDEVATKNIKVDEFLEASEVDQYKLVAFTEGPRISTYIYAVCAGEYKEIKLEKTYNNIPMSFYCRESLMPYLKEQSTELFAAHVESIKFFEQFFKVPFPFAKVDGVFAPEYNFGAMENVGCIVYNDKLINKESVSTLKRTRRFLTFYHEVAHMWFGNLVTMDWWNGLWLNESFADLAAYLALSRTSQHLGCVTEDAWFTFNRRKAWGYTEDQYKSTHPVAGDVSDTETALAIFDGITYAKGASCIKQLICLIGDENFSNGVGSYFEKFKWGNTTLDDFIGCLQAFYKPIFPNSPETLIDWQKSWLSTAGLNSIEPFWDPKDENKEAVLRIVQKAVRSEFPELRNHKLKIAFYNEKGEVYEVKDVVLNKSSETLVTYDGSKHPKALFLNHDDEGFVKTLLDSQSLNFFKGILTTIPSELNKGLIWRALYDMVKDGNLSSYPAILIAARALADETSEATLESIISYCGEFITLAPDWLRVNHLMPIVFNSILHRLKSMPKSDSSQLLMFLDALIEFASFGEELHVDNIVLLIEWLDGKSKLLGEFELSTEQKWAIVDKIYSYPRLSDTSKQKYFNKVALLDKSDDAKKIEKRLSATLLATKEREELWEKFVDPNDKTPLKESQELMKGYKASLRYDEAKEAKKFFDAVPKVFENKDSLFARNFYQALFPRGDNVKFYLESVRALEPKANNAFFKKMLGESLDAVERKEKGYRACMQDVMRLAFNIHVDQ